jgi:hypothetical protein
VRGKLCRTGASRRLAALCIPAVVVLAGAFASTASADVSTFPAGTHCSFALQVETIVDNSKAALVSPKADGDLRVIVTGRVVQRLTNLENGNSLEVNVSGPVFFTFHPDGTFDAVFAGRSELGLFPSDIPAGPIDLLNSGRLIVEAVLGGQHNGGLQAVVQAQTGHAEDLCAALA